MYICLRVYVYVCLFWSNDVRIYQKNYIEEKLYTRSYGIDISTEKNTSRITYIWDEIHGDL